MARGRSRSRTGEGSTFSPSNGYRSQFDLAENWLVGGDPLPRPLPPIRRSDVLEHDDIYERKTLSQYVMSYEGALDEANAHAELERAYGLDRARIDSERLSPPPRPLPLRMQLHPVLDPVGCFKRRVRREVMHALGIAGKRGLGKGGVKRKVESGYKC